MQDVSRRQIIIGAGVAGLQAIGTAKRLGAEHRGFDMTAWEIMDEALKVSGMWDAETNWQRGGQDFHLGFETSHFLDGFGHPDGRFRFAGLPPTATQSRLGLSDLATLFADELLWFRAETRSLRVESQFEFIG